MSQADKAYNLLGEMSEMNLNQKEVKLLEFHENFAGMTNKDGITQGLFEIMDISIDSLGENLKRLGYKRLPIQGIDLGNGFNGNVKSSDVGYYKMTLSHRSVIDQLIIFNFSRKRIIIYKAVN